VQRFRIPELIIGVLASTALWAVFLVIEPNTTAPNNRPEPINGHQAENVLEADKADERVARYTLWLTIFTGVLAVSTIGLWVVTWRGARVAKDSADAAKGANVLARENFVSSERPWLWLVDIADGGSVSIKGDEVRVTTQFVVKNLGKSPAVRVTVRCRIIPQIGDGAYVQRAFEDIFARYKNPNYFLQTVLAAGDSFRTSKFGTKIKRDELVPGGDRAPIGIIGFIDYQFTFQSGRHMTPFYFITTIPITPGKIEQLRDLVEVPTNYPAT
jgi:hypothetical protein